MPRKSSKSMTGPKPTVLAGVKWWEKYGCYRALVGGWLEIGFSYGSIDDRNVSGYRISVAGKQLVKPGDSPVDAAQKAVKAARYMLAKALDELGTQGGAE